MKLNIKFTALAAVLIAALMLLTPISQINTSGGGGSGNYDLDFLNSLDINNNNFVLSADQNSYSEIVSISNITSSSEGVLSTEADVIPHTTAITVSSTDELDILSGIVNGTHTNQEQPIESDFSGYTIVLTANLDFTETSFTPIGKDDLHTFNGTFDGQGYTISNLQVSDVIYAGLFGYLDSSATVKNLGITNSKISVTVENDTPYLGGIVGYNYGTISNCYNMGNVTASVNNSAYLGGIVGYNYGTITNCYNTGNVGRDVTSYDGTSGGITGENYGGTITNCYNTGNVGGTGSSGGISGSNSSTGTITNCYNKGLVKLSGTLGGIAGENYDQGTIINCYNIGNVESDADEYVSLGGIAGSNDQGTITDCYWSDKILNGVGDETPITNSSTFNDQGQVGNSPLYTLLNEWASTNYGNDGAYYLPWTNEKYPEFEIKHPVENGNGIYEIRTAGDLILVNNDLSGNYILLNDIDLSVYKKWAPIGGSAGFNGTFDGNGYTISKMTIAGDMEYAGLFGYIGNNGVVKNVGLIKSSIDISSSGGYASSGGIAGDNYGTITNCYNTGNVTANSESNNAYSGGISGYSEGTITNCYNVGNVKSTSESGDASSGGIAGDNYGGTITNCYNTGNVTANSESNNAYSGGISGYSEGTITNCYNTGDVTAEATSTNGSAYSGGIAGRSSETITNCYNTGSVTATANNKAYLGGIVGRNSETIINCYNIGNVESTSTNGSAYSGGIVGRNSDEGTITNCYNTGNVTANSESNNAYSGGIAGYSEGTITNCYNTGDVTAEATSTNDNAYSGGIAGYNNTDENNGGIGTITNTYYLNSNNITGIGNEDDDGKATPLDSNAMTGLKLLGGDDSNNNLNKEQNSMPWSPDIFNVNNGYPILADVPTQINPKDPTNKTPQSAVYILSETEDTQTDNYLEMRIGAVLTAKTIETTWEGLMDPQYNWYLYGSDKSQGSDATIDIAETNKLIVYYVTASYTIENTEYKYTSLTRSAYKFDNMILFQSNGGSYVETIVKNPGESISAPENPVKEGYTFTGWYEDEGLNEEYTFTTMPSGVTILYAGWEKNSITPPPTPPPYDPTPTPTPDPEPKPIVPDENNNITVPPIDEEKTEELINETISSGSDSIPLIDTSNVDGKYTEVTVSKSDLETISKKIENNNNINSVSIETSEGDIILDKEVLNSILETTDADSVSFEIEDAKDKLTEEQKKVVGDRPVYDINIKAGNENITSFNGKTITISLPYTLKAGEDPENIVVYYVKEDGSLEKVNCTYKDGKVVFETDHLSKYFIGYEEPDKPVTPDTPDDKKDDNNTIYYAVAAVIVILIIIALAYYFMKKKQ